MTDQEAIAYLDTLRERWDAVKFETLMAGRQYALSSRALRDQSEALLARLLLRQPNRRAVDSLELQQLLDSLQQRYSPDEVFAVA